MRTWFIGLLLLLSACTTTDQINSAFAPGSLTTRGDLLNSVTPHVDHHKHLMGPAIATIASGAPIASETGVPPEIERLLRAREIAWNDREALLPLFSENAVLLGFDRRGWVSGSNEVAEALSRLFGRPYSITPVLYARSGDTARLAGYFTRGEGSERQYVGYLYMSLVRRAGRWLIAAEVPRFPLAAGYQVKTAEQLIEELDQSGIRRAVVLSNGGWADGPQIPLDAPYPVVMAENDWTAQQASMFPDRLIAFCSFSPVADHALHELERCAANPAIRGLKFSFAMAGVDLRNADHVARLQAVFGAANANNLPIVVHTRGGPEYGTEHVEIFLRDVMPYSPDIVVQLAHLWGGEAYSLPALQAFADAIVSGRPHTRNLYFDVSEITAEVAATSTRTSQQEIAEQMRRIGIDRLLFGSDGQNAAQSWRSLVAFIPLHESEFRAIAENIAPYLRD